MNISGNAYNKIIQSWWLLKLAYGLLFVVAGADKFTHLVVDWDKYVSPLTMKLFPFFSTAHHFMFMVSGIEIAIGLLILTSYTRLGAYLAMIWLLLIVVNLLSMGMYFDIAVRDVIMAIGALELVFLTDIKKDLMTGQGK